MFVLSEMGACATFVKVFVSGVFVASTTPLAQQMYLLCNVIVVFYFGVYLSDELDSIREDIEVIKKWTEAKEMSEREVCY